MKKVCILFWALSVGALAFAQPDQAERVYDINTSITDAINNSQTLLYTSEEITVNKNRIKEAKSQLYPHLDINANISKFTVQDIYALSPGFGSTLLHPTSDEHDTYYAARTTLRQVIYSGGRVINNLRLAQTSLERVKTQYQEAKNNLIYDVRKTFYELLFQQERKKIYDQLLAVMQDVSTAAGKKNMNALHALRFQGMATRITAEAAEADRDAAQSRMEFVKVLNIEQDTRISLTGELEGKKIDDLTLHKCFAWADQYRPELKQTQFQEQIDSLSVNLSLSERYPTVFFGGSYEFNGSEFPLRSENWNATLGMNLPVFDGWSGWARVRQKRAQHRQGKLKKAQLQDQIYMESRRGFSDYQFWLSQIAPRLREVKHAEGLRAMVDADYKKGAVSSVDYLEALTSLADIRLRYLTAVKQELIAHAAIERVTGRALIQK
jgi:outer membrane protein TolC